MANQQTWRPVVFDCPRTGQKVQGLFADDTSGEGRSRYEAVACMACSGVHFVDPASGKVLGARLGK